MSARPGFLSKGLFVFLGIVALLGGMWVLFLAKPEQEKTTEPLVVYCAAGLKGPIAEIARAYEEEEGVKILVDYKASGSFHANIQVAKEGDLYIPADFSYIEMARSEELLDEDLPAATMTPVLAVPKGNPKKIRTLDDILNRDVKLAQANPDAAAVGKVTRDALTKIGKWEAIKSKTPVFTGTVNEVADAIQIGAVDAGIVWDAIVAMRANHLEAVPLDELKDVSSSVTVAVLRSCKQPAAALRFARYLTARDKGLPIFAKHGFKPIPDGDLWADGSPKVTLYLGAMLEPAVQETLKQFARREGIPEGNIGTVYNGCGILVSQMDPATGQRPDMFFACDATFMDQVKDLFIDKEIKNVSTNQLVIVVHKGNPKNIKNLGDLARKGLRVGIGDEFQCAMGVATQNTLQRSGNRGTIMANVVDQTPTGDMLVNKMLAGGDSLDAVIAYISNAKKAEDKLETYPIDVDCAIVTQPVAVGRESSHKHLMDRLVKMLTSAESRKRFESSGFKWQADKR